MPSADQPPPTPPADPPTGPRLFVSYTNADRPWAEWVAWQLEDAGYQIELDTWDFSPGEHFIQRMDQALARADRVVAILSEDYLASTYAAEEWWAALLRGRGEPARLLPVRVAPCRLPPLLAGRIHIDLVDIGEPEAIQRLRHGAAAAVRGVRGKPMVEPAFPGHQKAALPEAPPWPGAGLGISNLPARNPHFTGRTELLERLEEQLKAAGAAALVAAHGLGGVGKTQLALEYAHQHATTYELVWWVPADTPLAAVTALAALAPRLGLTVEADLEATAAGVVAALGDQAGWLLVFDNAEDPDLVGRLRPAGAGGRVLVTSRNPAFGQLGTRVEVEVWPVEDAAGFLLARTGERDPHAAEELADELGGLPLALAQAAAYCEQTSLDLVGYLDRYRTRQRELLAKGDLALVGYPETVATTWQLNLDRLQADQPAAVELLRLCAFLAPDAIPLDLLTADPARLPDGLAGVVADELALDTAVGGLYRFSLLRRDQQGLGVHRLVQAVVRDHLTIEQTRGWAACAVGLVAAAMPEQSWEFSAWPRAGALVAHAQAAAGHAQAYNTAPEDTARLLNQVGTYLWSRAELPAARACLDHALAITEAVHGREQPQVARTLGNLSIVLRDLGEFEEARDHLERVLAIFEAVHGGEHPDVAQARGNLGEVLRALGELEEARQHHQRALTIKDAVHGGGHPSVAITLTNLGLVLRDLGELKAAREHLERAVGIFRTTLGPRHARTREAERLLGDLGDDG